MLFRSFLQPLSCLLPLKWFIIQSQRRRRSSLCVCGSNSGDSIYPYRQHYLPPSPFLPARLSPSDWLYMSRNVMNWMGGPSLPCRRCYSTLVLPFLLTEVRASWWMLPRSMGHERRRWRRRTTTYTASCIVFVTKPGAKKEDASNDRSTVVVVVVHSRRPGYSSLR